MTITINGITGINGTGTPVTLSGAVTLSNKTLASPILTGTITSTGNPSLSIGTGTLTAGIGSFTGNVSAIGTTVYYNLNATNRFWYVGAKDTGSTDANLQIGTGSGFANDVITVTPAGNLGIGATPSAPLHVVKTGGATNSINVGLIVDYESTGATVNGGGTGIIFRGSSAGGGNANYNQAQIATCTNANGDNNAHGLVFYYKPNAGTSLTEAMRLDAAGNFNVGGTQDNKLFVNSGLGNKVVGYFKHSDGSQPYGIQVAYSALAPNGTGNEFLYCNDNAAARCVIRSNGGLLNYQANNANLSDRREKTNFAPSKNYLDILCQIPVQTFNYIDQNLDTDDGLNLGVVAQDVQSVAPELVTETNWGTREEPKMRMSIYQTDLQYAMLKAIQELSAKVAALEAK